MPKSSAISRNYLGAVSLYAVITAISLSAALYFQLSSLAGSQLKSLGDSLAEQLAETTKQPLLNSDIISVQVLLDQMVKKTPEVGRIAAYNGSNTLLAQSQRPGVHSEGLSAHSRPVLLDNTISGYIRVELRKSAILSNYLAPLWLALAIWAIATVVFAGWLLKQSRTMSKRLNSLSDRLPEAPAAASGNELDRLENQLAPLLNNNHSEVTVDESPQLLLAVSLQNISRLRAQLNAHHFDQLFADLDESLSKAAKLYNGKRMASLRHYAIIGFEADGSSELWQKILSCAFAITRLSQNLSLQEGIPLDVSCAVIKRQGGQYPAGWRSDLAMQDSARPLADLIDLAGPGEILVQGIACPDEPLDFCETQPLATVDAFQFIRFNEPQQAAFEQQLAFLEPHSKM
jgi:uncharacterized membrane protein affecting hemolysin expression